MAPHTYTPSYSANVCCPNVAYLKPITPPKCRLFETYYPPQKNLSLYGWLKPPNVVHALPNV